MLFAPVNMNEEDFTNQVISVIKRNAFVVKKILLNIEDCIPKSDFDEVESKLRQTKLRLERLEREDAEKKSRIETLLQQQRKLTDEITAQCTELADKQKALRQAQEKISQLETDLEKKTILLDEKTVRLAEFEENYFELERAFAAYKNLSDGTKFALEGVFGTGNSPINFLGGALQEGHLESLFDYVAINLNNDRNKNHESETLCNLFDFSFNAVNSGRREKIFSRLDIRIGDDFSSAEMRKTSDSPQSGTVQKILLVGYKYIRTNKVVRPSLVFLG